jgi:uncharacterized protein (TIGR02757 family)
VRTVTGAAARPTLASTLDRLYQDYNREDSASDPVHKVRPFWDPADREIAGFCAAALAFGRVASVLNSIDALLAIMGSHPAAYVRSFDPAVPHPELRALVHRWTRGEDLAALVWILRQMLEHSGSIESFFLEGDRESDADIGEALDSFSARALAMDVTPVFGLPGAASRARRGKGPGVSYFFPRPSAGSACKRLNLFLRWMVRKDEIDLGVWNRVSPARLIVPLDTHVIRLGRCLRLTRFVSPGWKMASDITASLRRLDPIDPIRFDFAICHVGMMSACGFGEKQGDSQCPLKGLCRPRVRPA